MRTADPNSSSAAAVESGMDAPGPCPRARPKRGESTEETALREVAEETGPGGPHHRCPRLHPVRLRPVRDAHPQDRPLLPDGAGRRRPGPGTTTSSTRSAGSTSTRRRGSCRSRPSGPSSPTPPTSCAGGGHRRIAAGPRRGRFVSEPTRRADAPTRRRSRGRHEALGARMIDFAGWRMPVQYTLHPRRAPRGPRTGRAVRPVAHGRAVGRGPGGRRAPSTPRWSAPQPRWPSAAPSTR